MLDPSATGPHSWPGTLAYILLGLVTGGSGVAWLTTWLNRRKPAAEVHETNARAELTLVKANVSASEMVLETTNTLLVLQEKAIALRDQLDVATRDATVMRTERDLLALQIQQCKETLERHGLKDELDKLFRKIG